jgi:hypothetical protein
MWAPSNMQARPLHGLQAEEAHKAPRVATGALSVAVLATYVGAGGVVLSARGDNSARSGDRSSSVVEHER